MLNAKIGELEKEIKVREWLNEWSRGKTRIETILPIMEIHSQLQGAANDEPGSWPKDFLQAMISEDWREWVMAIKAEIESWNLFDAAEEVAYHAMERGATLIPLGELFTRKRNGKFKFRQIAMGNMLKPGRDYGETFSTTISGDGLRWFFSLASTCGKKIYGWDATTGIASRTEGSPLCLPPVSPRPVGLAIRNARNVPAAPDEHPEGAGNERNQGPV
jgi:hypothetical protein